MTATVCIPFAAPDCPLHDWRRVPEAERNNGPHVFRCDFCGRYGWRAKVKQGRHAPPDPVRVYGDAGQARVAAQIAAGQERVEITARPMSARRGANGGYVPPGSSGGRR